MIFSKIYGSGMIHIIMLCLILILVTAGCSGIDTDEEGDSTTVFAVEIALAETGEVSFNFEESGEITPLRIAYLVPKVAGEVTAINARTGDYVKEGQVILSVENTYQELQLRQATAGWEAMKTELEQLEILAEHGVVPRAELRRLRAEFEQMELTLELAQYGFDVTVLKAPFDGVISELMVEEGQLIGNDPIGRIVNCDKVRVRVAVTEDYISRFYKGMIVNTSVPSAGVNRQGEVINIGKASVPETRSYMVEVEVDNPSGNLRPGMFATVVVNADPREAVLIPGTALYEDGNQSYIYIPGDKTPRGAQTARRVEVKTGLRQDGHVEIIEGLKQGESFILRPPPGFKEGSLYKDTGGSGE